MTAPSVSRPSGRPVVRRTRRPRRAATPLSCPLCRSRVEDTPRAYTAHLLNACPGWWSSW